MKFRPHRGSLQEAMRELKEVNSLQEIADYIGEPIDNIRIEEYRNGADNRIGWPITAIVIRKYHDGSEFPCGFTDSLTFN